MNSYEALRTTAAYVDLSDRGKFRLTGEDRARLLHAMSTNDVNHLPVQQGLYAFFLSAQGRILADAYIYNLGESLWLDTEPEVGPKLAAHLDKFIIADDVTIDDETDTYAAIALEGPEFVAAAARLNLPVPAAERGLEPWNNGFIARASYVGKDGLRLLLPVAEKAELVSRLRAADVPAATLDEAEVVRLENGVPRYGHDISERYLVQETEQLQAVHSNKGCYIGQEIVERVRSRGQVHRHLSLVRISGEGVPAAGAKLTKDGTEVGEITSAAYSPALNEVVALAYLRTEAAKPDGLLQLADRAVRVA